ncbi:MAG: circularly permuted type 2 ATP-grasp protein, partial [Actinomycetota bacterium]
MAWPAAAYDARSTYDEMLTPDGQPRAACEAVVARLGQLGDDVFQRQQAGEAAIRSMGVTFSLSGPEGNIDRSWPVDLLPRINSAQEWEGVAAGLIQRLKALNMFIDDLYRERQVIGDGIVPAELIDESPNYQPIC